MDYLEYKSLGTFQRIGYDTGRFLKGVVWEIGGLFQSLGHGIVLFFGAVWDLLRLIFAALRDGDFKTRLSVLFMGASSLLRGQIVKGLLYLGSEAAFLAFLFMRGIGAIKGLYTLGTQTQHFKIVPGQVAKMVPGDNSMLMLLYGVFALFIFVVFAALYFMNLKSALRVQEAEEAGRKLPGLMDDLRAYMDEKFYVSLLALPAIGVVVFTILPLLFMILIAFTNYDSYHQPPGNLFHWMGLHSFNVLLGRTSASGLIGATFFPVLGWTLIWALFSTASNYIFGILLALVINKKGVRYKGLFRTIFVFSMAVPQFVSLLVFRTMLDDHGPLNGLLMQLHLVHNFVPFLSSPTFARVSLLVVNLWIGIPYTLLIATGILMNIPADLFEAARIDGASAAQVFVRITLPYMLFVTTPYLITQFIGNLNNFNVIYLLTGGGPQTLSYYQAGKTDLLVTWLYSLTVNTRDYCFASAIGIFVFILSAVFSLIAFRHTASYTNEEAFG